MLPVAEPAGQASSHPYHRSEMGRPPGRSWAQVLTREFLERELAEGRSVAQIAATVGCAENTVRSYLALHQLQAPRGGVHPPGREELAGTYGELGTIGAVGQRYGVSFATARRWLLEAGVPLRPPARRSLEVRGLDLKAAARRYAAGETLAALAQDLGVSASALRQSLVEAGVPTRPRGPRPRRDTA